MAASFDPISLPIDSIADEAALASTRLTEAFLRWRFQQRVEWTPERAEETSLNISGEFRPASVLLPLVVREHGLQMLLTQRASHLHHHAGQISFPGGRVDDTDTSIEHTALREAEEEIGLSSQHIEVLGHLPQYFTGTGFQVTPVVALVHPPFELKSDPIEVASIFEVPFVFLMNPENHQRRLFELPNGAGRRKFYAMPYQNYFIWGVTAGILRNLFHFLNARLPE